MTVTVRGRWHQDLLNDPEVYRHLVQWLVRERPVGSGGSPRKASQPSGMARYVDVHPDNPQPRSIAQVVQIVRDGGVIVYPTDASYAFGFAIGNAEAADQVRRIRGLGDRHHFTLVCRDFGQLGQFVQLDQGVFRQSRRHAGAVHLHPPRLPRGPRRLQHPKKPPSGHGSPSTRSSPLLAELGEPLMSSTVILPGDADR